MENKLVEVKIEQWNKELPIQQQYEGCWKQKSVEQVHAARQAHTEGRVDCRTSMGSKRWIRR